MEQSRGRDEVRAPGAADDVGVDARSDESGGAAEGGVLTLVCFTCGMEYYFADGEQPEGLSCEKCKSTVFRSFFSGDEDDEVAADFRDSTERDLDPDDAEGEALPGDVLDLNR